MHPWQVWAGWCAASSRKTFLVVQEKDLQQESASGGERAAPRADTVDVCAGRYVGRVPVLARGGRQRSCF